MDSRTPEEVMQFALAKYSEVPDYDKVTYYNNSMEKLVTGQILFQSKGCYAISSDPLEDADDLIMLRYGCMNTKSNLVVVISNGYHASAERLDLIKELFPCFQGAEFNVPFKTPNNTILFKEDGCELDMELDGYLNAGPIHSRTLASIAKCLKKVPTTRVVTVGAKDDCTLGGGLNQKQTDEPGKLITVPNVWNQFIADIKGVSCENLSVELSRHVLIPNPLYMLHTSYGEMAHDSCIDQLVDNVGMFMASRPDPAMPVAARINEGNSIVDYKYLQLNLANEFGKENYEVGLEKLGEYMELAKSKGVDKAVYESAAIPIMTTHMFGGRYKPGQFGWAPVDATAKHEAACLLPETVPLFKENIKKLRYMSPAYDVIAFIKMMA